MITKRKGSIAKYIDIRKLGQIGQQKVRRATQRRWRIDEVHQQEQSYFMTRLPPEVRHLIYMFLWKCSSSITEVDTIGITVEQPTVETSRELLSEGKHGGDVDYITTKSSHSLSLLLTCRKIYLDAAFIAFNNHTFTVSNPSLIATYVALSRLTSRLPILHVASISRLAYDTSSVPSPYDFNQCARPIAHSLLLFPSLTLFELRIMRSGLIESQIVHDAGIASQAEGRPELVPVWFYRTVSDAINGRVYAWQKGEKWSVMWPQEEDFDCAHIASTYNSHVPNVLDGMNMTQYPGICPSLISPCECGCGMPCWLSATLVQETGRPPVSLQVMYYSDQRKKKPRRHTVQLVPGVTNVTIHEGTGRMIGSNERTMAFGWDAKRTGFWRRVRARESWRGAVQRWRKNE